MITHTSDSVKNNTKSKLEILKNCWKFKFFNFASNFSCDTPSEVTWWDKYEMGPTRTVVATERTPTYPTDNFIVLYDDTSNISQNSGPQNVIDPTEYKIT